MCFPHTDKWILWSAKLQHVRSRKQSIRSVSITSLRKRRTLASPMPRRTANRASWWSWMAVHRRPRKRIWICGSRTWLSCARRPANIRWVPLYMDSNLNLYLRHLWLRQCRGWGIEIDPELYKKQRDLWDQVSKRSSLSALSLASTVHRWVEIELM